MKLTRRHPARAQRALCFHALERGAALCRRPTGSRARPRCPGRVLPDLLVAGVRLPAAARPLSCRRPGSYAGLLRTPAAPSQLCHRRSCQGQVPHLPADRASRTSWPITTDRQRTIKRGGEFRLLALSGTLVQTEPDAFIDPAGAAAAVYSLDRVFDQQWAVALVKRALSLLGEELTEEGRGNLFAALRPMLGLGEQPFSGQEEVAHSLRMPLATFAHPPAPPALALSQHPARGGGLHGGAARGCGGRTALSVPNLAGSFGGASIDGSFYFPFHRPQAAAGTRQRRARAAAACRRTTADGIQCMRCLFALALGGDETELAERDSSWQFGDFTVSRARGRQPLGTGTGVPWA